VTERTHSVSVESLSALLQESNTALLARVLRVVDAVRVAGFVEQTLKVEADGGMLTEDKSRRRTPGGVFFQLVKQSASRKERYRIFGGGPGQGPAQAPMPAMCTWEELIEATKTLPFPTGEEASVKITLIGRPGTPVQTKGQTVMFKMQGKAPGNLPKGLPPIPKSPPITWTVIIGLRQWNRVRDSLAQHPDDKLILDGYPHVEGDQHLVLVNGCRSMLMERAQKESQREERAAQGGATP
jgi:hypothetical protein